MVRLSFLQIIYGVVTLPFTILFEFLKGKRVPTLFTDLHMGIRENRNTLYYTIQKYTNKNQELVQYVKFYLPIRDEFRNVTNDLVEYMKLRDKLVLQKGKVKETVLLKDFDMFYLSKKINEVFDRNVQLVRIDTEVTE